MSAHRHTGTRTREYTTICKQVKQGTEACGGGGEQRERNVINT